MAIAAACALDDDTTTIHAAAFRYDAVADATATHIGVYVHSRASVSRVDIELYADGRRVVLARAQLAVPKRGAWNAAPFAAPVSVAMGDRLRAVLRGTAGGVTLGLLTHGRPTGGKFLLVAEPSTRPPAAVDYEPVQLQARLHANALLAPGAGHVVGAPPAQSIVHPPSGTFGVHESRH